MSDCGSESSTCGTCAPGAAAPVPVTFVKTIRKAAGPESRFAGTDRFPAGLMIGLDVGSTTVKAVAVEPQTGEILWRDYQRHETRQAAKVLEFLRAIEAAFPDVPHRAMRLFMTGSGGSGLLELVGGKFVQEVNAVCLAVEKLYPDVNSVVELGGQDAKIVVFKEVEGSSKKKIPSMNDKCAGGTGAVIDKIAAKLKIPAGELCEMGYDGIALHPVAGKCGVFAETDINSLQKQGVPPAELMASLFESIVQQNLSVLTRGHTLRPRVLLLGGPNTFIRGMRECWQHNIPAVWAERGVALPDPAAKPADFVVTPENAQYFAALGAVEFGKGEVEDDPSIGLYRGCEALRQYLEGGTARARQLRGLPGLVTTADELAAFKARYRKQPWVPASFRAGECVEAFLGIDGGSTSTKGVLIGTDRRVLAKAYRLSKGNPIEDTIEIVGELARQVTEQGADLNVLGVGTTGYAKDILREVLQGDVALVETVAHTEACLHFYPGTDVIVDVGGQDIKLIILKDGRVKDFKLNTQCSAGNGYFLQATAQAFGTDVRDYADLAFAATQMPEFGYGCAVFMQSDIVDFQRQGWQPNEIMAGLAAVLPKNIWLYVAQIPNVPKLGRRFVLQGGTQHNLAAVKAQVDFIASRFKGTGVEPEIRVHEHCGESGAIGCALEAHRLWAEQGRVTQFIGVDRVGAIRYDTHHNEDTRCYFCKNKCVRTFIDVFTGGEEKGVEPISLDTTTYRVGPNDALPGRMKHGEAPPKKKSKVASKIPLPVGHQRLIVATCEKGTVEDLNDMRRIKAGLDEVMEHNPNFVALAAKSVFRDPEVPLAADPAPDGPWLGLFARKPASREARMARRKAIRIGIPRVLGIYAYAPFVTAYFESLGVPFENLVFSDYTDQELYKRGAKRGAIDPCFPSKLGIPHVHDLLYRQHKKKPLTHVFFPMVDSFPTYLDGVTAARACPTAVGTIEATHAAFVKEGDLFKENGIVFKKTFLNLDEAQLAARQMHLDWRDELDLTYEESLHATEAGLAAMERHYAELRRQSREVLDRLESEDRIGIVVLARPYHNDPGVNHEIVDELQKHGYPIFWQDTLPRDPDLLERLFGEEVRAGVIPSPLAISDAWKNSYSENTSRKIWAAKYAARHPNLVALELSSFKCGHDAPIYTVVEEIIENSGTPYFCFKDIDENKPAGSIKIRVETIAYFLARYREHVAAEHAKRLEIERVLAEFEARLRAGDPAALALVEATAEAA